MTARREAHPCPSRTAWGISEPTLDVSGKRSALEPISTKGRPKAPEIVEIVGHRIDDGALDTGAGAAPTQMPRFLLGIPVGGKDQERGIFLRRPVLSATRDFSPERVGNIGDDDAEQAAAPERMPTAR